MNIVDQLVVVLELDSTKFKPGIDAAKAALTELDAIVKGMDGALRGMAQSMQATGNEGAIAGKKVNTGFKSAGEAIFAATKRLGEFKASLASQTKGALGAEEIKDVSESIGDTANSLDKLAGKGILANAGLQQFLGFMNRLNAKAGVGALKDMILETTEKADKTLSFADAFKIDIKEVQAFQDSAKMWHGTAESAQKDLENIMQRVGAMGTKIRGGKMATEAFKIAGITDLDVQGKKVYDIVTKLSDAYGKGLFGTGDMGVQRMMAATRALGISDPMRQAMMDSGELFKKNLENYRRMANSRAEMEEATKANVRLLELEVEWEHAKVRLIQQALPMVEKITGLMNKLVEFMSEHSDGASIALYGIAGAITAVTLALNAMMLKGGWVALKWLFGAGGGAGAGGAAAAEGVTAAVGGMRVAMAGFAAELGPLLLLLGAIAAAIWVVKEAMDHEKKYTISDEYRQKNFKALGGGSTTPAWMEPGASVGMVAPSLRGSQYESRVDIHNVTINAGAGADGAAIADSFHSGVVNKLRNFQPVYQATQATF